MNLSLPAKPQSDNVTLSYDHLESVRARKRPRLSTDNVRNDESNDILTSLAQKLTKTMTGQAVSDFDSLAITSTQYLRRTTEEEKHIAILALGKTACQLAMDTTSNLECELCDQGRVERVSTKYALEVDKLLATLDSLQLQTERGVDVRNAALESYRRLLNHVSGTRRLTLTKSQAGKFCLQSLRVPERDSRVRSASLLRTLLKGSSKSAELEASCRNDRIAAFEYLAKMWQTETLPNQETVIVCLFKMAEVVGDEELNIILLRVIEYLGHPNAYISGLVATELLQLASTLNKNLQGLLRPFWSTISVVVVKNLASRPVIAETLGDLLGMQMFGLLSKIEEDSLPYLILTNQVDTIQRIASAGSSPTTAFDLCVKQTNHPKIFANLLAQAFPDPEETIMKILCKVSADFGEQDLAAWLSLNHSKIACELLKLAADAGYGKESKPLQGLQLLAQLSFKRASGSSGSRRSDQIPMFLETNAWEMVTIFTSILSDTTARGINIERRNCLKALGDIVKLGKGRISFIVPSICACLRSAMSDLPFVDTPFMSWLTMFVSLDESDIVGLIDQTLAVTIKAWPDIAPDTRQTAKRVLKQVLAKNKAAIQDCIDEIPSLISIPELSEIENELQSMRQHRDALDDLSPYVYRLRHDTLIVVQLALTELVDKLRAKSDLIHASLIGEQPDNVIAELIRAILDCRVNFGHDLEIMEKAAQCLGAIGQVDPSRVESVREKSSMVVLSNFGVAAETTSFLMFFMQNVVVKEYLSAATLRSKTFLGWSLQELLKLCQITPEVASRTRVAGTLSSRDRQWLDLHDETRLVLTPFLTSKFLAPPKKATEKCLHPIFKPQVFFEKWLTDFTLELLTKGSSPNTKLVFDVCWRMVRFGQGTTISTFLLPYAALNSLLDGTEQDRKDLEKELLCVLRQPCHELENTLQENVRRASQSVFDVLDYLSKWVSEKRRWYANAQIRAERGLRDPAMEFAPTQIDAVEALLKSIPPQAITERSIECKSYARALLHWEEHIHSKQDPSDDDYRRLQDIYSQIDEPDGIEGISSCMRVLNAESQILEHKKAGRWQAAHNWYEMCLTESPDDLDIQLNLLHALCESGQHDVLLHHFGGMYERLPNINAKLLPYATQAAWSTAQFDTMAKFVQVHEDEAFNMQLASKMLLLRDAPVDHLQIELDELWLGTVRDLSYNTTTTIASSTEALLRAHVVEDLRLMTTATIETKNRVLEILGKRLDVLGTDLKAKHYVSGIQRALMQLRKDVFNADDVAASWIQTAKIARKARDLHQALDAVLRAAALGDQPVIIEQAKLMWLDGRHRKAINTLESAIQSGAFSAHAYIVEKDSMHSKSAAKEQNDVTARAYVLLGKWLSSAGQTQSEVILKTFNQGTDASRNWERTWYHLGRHYNKMLESQQQNPPGKEPQEYLNGVATKLVIQTYLKALVCGNKYLFQTLPKVLTLWLDLVSHPELEADARRGNTSFHEHNRAIRKKTIQETNGFVKKFIQRLQPVALYTILPQLVARICYPDKVVHDIIQIAIARVIHSFPQQALWTLMAVTKSIDKTRASRGLSVINKVVELHKQHPKAGMTASELRTSISHAQRFTDELLRVADYHIEGKVPKVSLSRDLGFNHKIAPSKLVVPVESCLIPNISLTNDAETLKTFQPFSKDPATIFAFQDEAVVLSSLQKPRKMSIKGSDGHLYAILAKPKDDLRKDQRLMEFDTMINRFLKRDIDASKRRLYIRTYAVIPLNEECGVIEWVNSLKTMRDVLLKLYRDRNIIIDYGSLRTILDDICARSTDKAKDYTERVLPMFPPVLRYWFIETFSDPGAWLSARIRYTRSAAVMSMVGHILGLGDRHGENILFEEENGGAMHVDFNCLFDKGLTFDKPECVPFRLTHNMVDAFGTFGVEGPFRKSCEITMTLLRNHEDGLMTVLETFLHDPTTDFQTAGKRRRSKDPDGIVPDTAEKMLEGVKGKVRGMLAGDSVPLSVSGYVEEMIRQACDRANLARMYIGWCAFL